jgi:hypothetical protein
MGSIGTCPHSWSSFSDSKSAPGAFRISVCVCVCVCCGVRVRCVCCWCVVCVCAWCVCVWCGVLVVCAIMVHIGWVRTLRGKGTGAGGQCDKEGRGERGWKVGAGEKGGERLRVRAERERARGKEKCSRKGERGEGLEEEKGKKGSERKRRKG